MIRSNKGFTIIEMIIIIVIMITVMSVAIPSFRSFRKNKEFKVSLKMLVTAMQTARSNARTRNKNYYLVLAPDNEIDAKLSLRAFKIGEKIDTGFKTEEDWIYLAGKVEFQIFGIENTTINFPHDNSSSSLAVPVVEFEKKTGNIFSYGTLSFNGYMKRIEFGGSKIEIKDV